MLARHFAKHLAAIAVALSLSAASSPASERTLLDNGWRFAVGDHEAALIPRFNDSQWQQVDLPHDWSIHGERTSDAPGEGHFGYFPAGAGWYRRTLDAPAAWQGQHVALHFEGVYHRGDVWCNGERVGGNQGNGYVPFRCDLTPHLNLGESNVITVRVRNDDLPNSRWYTGSGIYRHVWLEVSPPVRLAPDGVILITERGADGAAKLTVRADVLNQSDANVSVALACHFHGADGRKITHRGEQLVLKPGEHTLEESLAIADPQLWSPDSPTLHDVAVTLVSDNRDADSATFRYGLRTVDVSPERGLLLNGAPVQLCGGCVHSDLGPLGAASFDDAERRRVQLLKDAGFNCIRTAHNPPSVTFLNVCDELGMLVIDEAFDGWEAKKVAHDADDFPEQHEAIIDALVRRDRNHPSVIIWSVGNEMYERAKPRAVLLAAKLRGRVLQHDATRPVSAAICGLWDGADWTILDPLFAVLDVGGYNYETSRMASDHQRVPSRVMYGSETYPKDAFEDWQATTQHPYVIGAFVWSAMDYLGEASIGRAFPPGELLRHHWEGSHFPWHGAACGDLDLIGDRRPHSYYRQIVWDRGRTLAAAVQTTAPDGGAWQLTKWAVPPWQQSWTWPGREGELMAVVAFSRYDAVRLELNGRVVGEAPTTVAEQFRAEIAVAYQPGTLAVIGLEDGQEVERFELVTAEAPAAVQLAADQQTLAADRQSLAFVDVTIADAHGRCCPQADHAVTYSVTGPAEIVAVGSADLTTEQTYQANPRQVYQGRGLVVLRSTGEAGAIEIIAEAADCEAGRLTVAAEVRAD
ncbi:MAG: beta-galactosidase [Planctomycetaceae bacterium]|nr:beta-galactosidase [Planctomycetaceae bacterium]